MTETTMATIRRLLINDLFIDKTEEAIGLDDDLAKDVGLDSIGCAELRVLCERTFNVQIPEEEYGPENFKSVRSLATLVQRLQAGG